MEGFSENDWKLIKIEMMILKKQLEWPHKSFDCVLFLTYEAREGDWRSPGVKK